jgi:hypothetical protein
MKEAHRTPARWCNLVGVRLAPSDLATLDKWIVRQFEVSAPLCPAHDDGEVAELGLKPKVKGSTPFPSGFGTRIVRPHLGGKP